MLLLDVQANQHNTSEKVHLAKILEAEGILSCNKFIVYLLLRLRSDPI